MQKKLSNTVALEAVSTTTNTMASPIANIINTIANLAETVEFGALLSAAAKAKFFQFLMEQAGTYLFSVMLIIKIIQFIFKLYNFSQSLNKDISKIGSLLWNGIQLAIIGTAIIGTLLAASVFTIITPALFAGGMALDTGRNAALLAWNTYLYFYCKNSKNNRDPLDTHKRNELCNKYHANISQHAKGALIGAIVTAGVSIIFLFPKIGLGAIASAGFVI